MTQEPFDTFIEDIPAYVLGALSRAETAALKAHLETCSVCQAEFARYQQVGDGLLAAVLPLKTPPPDVQRKLMDKVTEKATPVRSKFRWGFKQFASAALVLVLACTNVIGFLQIRNLRQQQVQLASQLEESRNILGMLAASTEVHPVSGDGFSGNLLLDREKNLSYLLVWNLPLPPDDSVYQIWLVSPEGDRVDAGSFRPNVEHPFTSTALVTSRNITDFVGVEVTIEPLGGSDAPTGQQILSVGY